MNGYMGIGNWVYHAPPYLSIYLAIYLALSIYIYLW